MRFVPWLAAAALWWLSAQLGASTGRALGEFRAQEELLYFTSGEQLKWMAPGFEGLLADAYWLRTVQYFGRALMRRHGGPEIGALVPLVEITIALDPKFREAYVAGATFIGEPPPIGPGNAQAAVRILERGAVELPTDWILQQFLGYSIFIHLGDTRRAADRLLRASRLPGAPFWLETFAAGLLTEGGERDKARRIWTQMRAQANGGAIALLAERNLSRLDALDVLEQLNQRVAVFEEAHGRGPTTRVEFEALAQGLPTTDPTGAGYAYDKGRRKFVINPSSMLWSPWADGPQGAAQHRK